MVTAAANLLPEADVVDEIPTVTESLAESEEVSTYLLVPSTPGALMVASGLDGSRVEEKEATADFMASRAACYWAPALVVEVVVEDPVEVPVAAEAVVVEIEPRTLDNIPESLTTLPIS